MFRSKWKYENIVYKPIYILNRDALWSIQGKKHYLLAAVVRGIQPTEKILRLTFS